MSRKVYQTSNFWPILPGLFKMLKELPGHLFGKVKITTYIDFYLRITLLLSAIEIRRYHIFLRFQLTGSLKFQIVLTKN